jgi:hypothetical protein
MGMMDIGEFLMTVFFVMLACILVGIPLAVQLAIHFREHLALSIWPGRAYLIAGALISFSVPVVGETLFRDWSGSFPFLTFSVYIAAIFTSLGTNLTRLRPWQGLAATATHAVILTALFTAGFLSMTLFFMLNPK